MPNDPTLEAALRDLEQTATSFALRLGRIAEVRRSYVEQIREMSASLRAAVNSGEMAPARGAEIANAMRNQIMEMHRAWDYDLGGSVYDPHDPVGAI